MAQGYLADENGVVIQELDNIDRVVCLDDGDRILRKGVLEYLKDTADIKYHFIKINPKIFDKYCKKYSILPYLTCHIGYMDNICLMINPWLCCRGKRIYLSTYNEFKLSALKNEVEE